MTSVHKRALILKVIAEVYSFSVTWSLCGALSFLLLWKQGRSRWSHWLASSRSRGGLWMRTSGESGVSTFALTESSRRSSQHDFSSIKLYKQTDSGVFLLSGPWDEVIQIRIIQRSNSQVFRGTESLWTLSRGKYIWTPDADGSLFFYLLWSFVLNWLFFVF